MLVTAAARRPHAADPFEEPIHARQGQARVQARIQKPAGGRDGRLGGHRRPRSARAGRLRLQAVLGRLDRVRRRAQQPRLARRCGDARHAARHQRRMHRAGRAHRARAPRQDQPAKRVRPQELLLPGSAAGLSDQPVQAADRGRGRGRDRRRRRDDARRHRAAASGAGRRQVDPRPAPGVFLRRSQSFGRRADGDRVAPRHALGQAGAGLRDEAAHDPALSRHVGRRHGEGQPARRRQRVRAQARRRSSARAARSRTSTPSASSARRSRRRRGARSTSSRTAAR